MGKGIFWGQQNEGYPEHPTYSFSEYWDQSPWQQILMRHWLEGEDPVCDVRWVFGERLTPQERAWGEPGVDCRVCNWDVPTESWGNTCDFCNKRSTSPINFWANYSYRHAEIPSEEEFWDENWSDGYDFSEDWGNDETESEERTPRGTPGPRVR